MQRLVSVSPQRKAIELGIPAQTATLHNRRSGSHYLLIVLGCFSQSLGEPPRGSRVDQAYPSGKQEDTDMTAKQSSKT